MKKNNILIFVVMIFFLFGMGFASSISAAVHIPEKYVAISAGERIYFEVEIKYPENEFRKDIGLTYKIIDESGDLIVQSKVLKAIETQASFIDFLILPETSPSGDYLIHVSIDDKEELDGNIYSSFKVVGSDEEQIRNYFLILFLMILIVGLLVIVDIILQKKIYKRKKS